MYTLEQMIEKAHNTARSMMEGDGDVIPNFVGQMPNDKLIPVIGFEPESMDELTGQMEAARDTFLQYGVTQYVYTQNGYCLEGEALKRRDMDGLRECVAYVAVNSDGRKLIGNAYVLRPEHSAPTLSPVKFMSDKASCGLAGDLLKPAKETAKS